MRALMDGFVGFFIGFGLAIVLVSTFTVRAAPQERHSYKVIAAERESTLQKEMDQLVSQGCKPMFGMGDASTVVIFECP